MNKKTHFFVRIKKMNRSNTGKHFKTVNQKQSLHPIIFYYFLHFFCTKPMIEFLINLIDYYTSSVIYTVYEYYTGITF